MDFERNERGSALPSLVSSAQMFGFSALHSFVTPPAPGPEAEVFLLHIADMGQAEVDGSNELSMMAPSLDTTKGMLADLDRLPYRLVIHNGDISYARLEMNPPPPPHLYREREKLHPRRVLFK